jgi:hypothetical protein
MSSNNRAAWRCACAALVGSVLILIVVRLLQPDHPIDLGIGFYLWGGSFCLLALANWIS